MMSSAPRYLPHYTVEDYRQWAGDWQLIDGVAVAMTPSPFGPHERAVAELVKSFGAQLDAQACDCRVYAGLDWIVRDDTVVRPDVMIVCGRQPEQHLERAPHVAVEVLSSSTRELDETTKRELYRQYGVAFYLIADTNENQIEVIRNREPVKTGSETVAAGDIATLDVSDRCRLTIDPRVVFR